MVPFVVSTLREQTQNKLAVKTQLNTYAVPSETKTAKQSTNKKMYHLKPLQQSQSAEKFKLSQLGLANVK